MYEHKVKIKSFLTPLHEYLNSDSGKDFATHIWTELEKTKKYTISNVMEQSFGFGFWINIKKEKFCFNISLLNAKEKLWLIKLKPKGIAKITYFIMSKTFRGERIVNDLSIIIDNLKLKEDLT